MCYNEDMDKLLTDLHSHTTFSHDGKNTPAQMLEAAQKKGLAFYGVSDHFDYDYDVCQYATGYSAAIALSRRILREGENAVKDYLQFLSGGCSKSPIELLQGAGVDMTSPEPVDQALALFGELLDEMETLVEEF